VRPGPTLSSPGPADLRTVLNRPPAGPNLGRMYRWRRTIVVVLMVALVALLLADVIVGLAG
jgi:hypothetical protein